jgi:hypothetical protein
VLKPLDDLTRAEDLDGLARGLAFRLAESLGVLFRRDVAEMIKDLDQTGARQPCANTASASAPITFSCRRCSSPRRRNW